MKRRTALMMAALAMLPGNPALAAPPTVTPSPGYDARLQESRRPSAATTDPLPTPPITPPAPQHHPRRSHPRH